jgi:hypothetical protein
MNYGLLFLLIIIQGLRVLTQFKIKPRQNLSALESALNGHDTGSTERSYITRLKYPTQTRGRGKGTGYSESYYIQTRMLEQLDVH